jgi:putative N6-adenine-specific DNA methylase
VQRIIVRFDHDRCTISADSSGELLHRRGWRQAVAKAPLRETLAAAMLSACEWTGAVPLVDPFCGSGTIGIEAALRARNIAPGLARTFAMEHWPGTDSAMVSGARAIARAAAKPSTGSAIVMSDRDEGAVAAARANAERAGVLEDLTIERRSLSETALADLGETGLLLTNPPYGLRLSDGADLRGLYARLGEVLRAGGRGWRLGMLVADRGVVSSVRLPMDTVLRTSNGGIPVSVEMTRPAR